MTGRNPHGHYQSVFALLILKNRPAIGRFFFCSYFFAPFFGFFASFLCDIPFAINLFKNFLSLIIYISIISPPRFF